METGTHEAAPDTITLLKLAGASPADLTRFENMLQRMWPDDMARVDEYVRTTSRSDLVAFVQRLHQSSLDDQYIPGADYAVRAGVPQGKVFTFTYQSPHVLPGTTRRVRVYVPAEYIGDKPACVLIYLQDLPFLVPRALDNLIYDHQIPTLMAIGVGPGTLDSRDPPADPRQDRSLEFDGMSDQFARFVLEELLPEIEHHKTPDGLPIILSKDPNDRAVGGLSSAGTAAFTLAWTRPDAFRRVFIGIGTFVAMRGGDRYPALVRKMEPKPLRIFMQDGSNDELTSSLGEIGDWWMGNQTMERALEFAGYQVEHIWGEGTHDDRHMVTVFPDAMRWLWKDWPRPVTAGESGNTFLKQILRPGQRWEMVPGAYRSAGALAASSDGSVMFWDTTSHKGWRISANTSSVEPSNIQSAFVDLAYGPDGRTYVADATNQRIVAYDNDGTSSIVAGGMRASSLTVTHGGDIYLTEPGTGDDHEGSLWLITRSGARHQLDRGLHDPTGVTLTPDGQWLAVAESRTHWGYSYRVKSDGSVDGKQQFYWFHVADDDDDSGAGPWAVDRDGRLYAATRTGIQVFDRNGRVRAILPTPGGAVIGLTFGGPFLDTLYVSCADHKVYRRLVQTTGAPAWAAPIKLPPGSAG